ncbi:hypothetical protein OEZ86_009609 [Tetradesmus obliquus]|uniref:riboflavin kinase n=1 Tax=Tetradesmus obliquus TaxID=3088 RepID=A0ABY8UMQ9_TETOB|nr:hypothetical protein OEZ85_001053 [Tetradesmus obliquus]WIA43084.1 hypothetical protein OEZ86_009609 [Tetradesmus obliquus]
MAAASPAAFIFDLDGLIIDTESLCIEVAQQVLAQHGKVLTKEAQRTALGKRPLDCWRDVAALLGLDVPAQQLFDQTEPLLEARWADVRPLPGARRLLQHLSDCGAKVAIATSTSRATFGKKLSKKPWLQELFQASVCGDEVTNGKPAPDVFAEAARQLGVAASSCLCFEDAPSGVEGAVAAGMRVVVVPSLVEAQDEFKAISQEEAAASGKGGVVQVLPSLLAFDPTIYGLPPFGDLVEGVIPLDPVFTISGTVVKGFGRGSKELGIPTANVDADSLRHSIAEAVTGIYCGWASIGDSSEVYKMVMSIGWNPFYNNTEKTAEPWILHDFEQPFYGQEIRLLVCGYVRPEANFTSLEALVARIHKDGEVSKAALSHPQLQHYAAEAFLQPAAAAAAAAGGVEGVAELEEVAVAASG